MTYIAPNLKESKFTCPHCGAISMQQWAFRTWEFDHAQHTFDVTPIGVSRCAHCSKYGLWLFDKMLYPDVGMAPQPNPALPEPVRAIYLEAAAISSKSPRGAAALLRLAIQVLCKELGAKGDNINADIALLVEKGLPERVQQAFDIVRVTGNHAVHPGQIDVDDPGVVGRLFDLINVIAEYTISMPARIGSIYGELPESAHEQIKKRDKKD